ncbi:Glutathione S-transferase omega-like 2 [Pseudocercospora fuligena]|uniref:Glutathione S-transferase omega-like 2 n=1 Tax=Pseudocercospora fuligena TaxID=685502 RepID=A0A8H6REX3_9PEZI|nr:Glutathione S-transferase omega-like 2 [Pseudocercospora fuligena]
MASATLPKEWHSGPDDSFHGKITEDGPFKPEKDRYHLYIGLFCPFAHRANFVLHLKQLDKYAGIETSIVRPYPKGNSEGFPGWRFNVKDKKDEEDRADYEGATVDKLFGSRYMHELYFKADKDYKGRYSVPVLWDKKLNTIVNNESHELLRDLQTGFDSLLPTELAKITLYPEPLRAQIDHLGEQLQRDLNTGVYKAGFAPDQATYEKNLPPVFAMLNRLEELAASNGGPYILGKEMTEVDVRTYCTLIRFDVVYVQHFKCNLGMLRYSYPTLNNWLKGMYWNHHEAQNTTDFRHIKENYTKSHYDINPKAITPVGPWPHIDRGYEQDWTKVSKGEIDMPEVLEYEKKLGQESEGKAREKGFSLDRL